MVTDPEVEAIWRRHYTSHPQGRLPEHWAGPRGVRVLLEALGLEPLCRCEARGAEVTESEALGAQLVRHLPDCAWLEWTQRTGGCMGDPEPEPEVRISTGECWPCGAPVRIRYVPNDPNLRYYGSTKPEAADGQGRYAWVEVGGKSSIACPWSDTGEHRVDA